MEATKFFDTLRLDGAVCAVLIEYLNQRGNQTVTEDQQLVVAIQLKNQIKKIFGNNEDYVEYSD